VKLLKTLLLLTILPIGSIAQNYLEMPVSIQMQNASLASVFNELERQLQFNFSYEAQLVNESQRLTINEHNTALKKVLKKSLGKNYDYKVVGTHVIIQGQLPKFDNRAERFSVSGQVLGPEGEPLDNAIVYEANRQSATLTGTDGYYQLNFKDRNHPLAINISRAGYRDTIIYVNNGHKQKMKLIPLPEQRMVPANFEAINNKATASIADNELQTMNDIKLVKFMVNDEALYVSNNLNAFNWQTAQVSLLPYFGTNDLMNGLTTNNVSFNVIGGYTAQIEGAEFGAASNFIQNSVYGFQAGGVSNVVGKDVIGFQAAGVANVILGNLEGGQAAGVFNRVKGHHTGFMAAGVANVTESGNNNPKVNGINGQVSGLVNLHLKDTTNIQITSVLNQAEAVKGVQISAVANYTKKLNGVQIGIVNIADTVETGVPIGLVNIIKHGYHAIELSTNETFKINAAFKTGGKHLYSYLNAGFDKYFGVGYGFGYTTNYTKKVSFNTDVNGMGVFDGDAETNSYMGTLFKGQLAINYHLAKHLTISTGPSYNFFMVYKDTGSVPPADLSKPSGAYFGKYYLDKAVSIQSHQNWLGWHFSLRF